MAVSKLAKDANGAFLCPQCGGPLRTVEGGTVVIRDGKADLEGVKPRYECGRCRVFYRELLNSGYYDAFDMPKLKAVGDLAPTILRADAEGHAPCPRCGGQLDLVEWTPVKVVDGKADMENISPHFRCASCDSVFRRIATTEYFQWSEK